MEDISPFLKKIYNEGERLIPGITHDMMELARHRSSYSFFRKVIELDLVEKRVFTPVRIIDIGCGTGHGCYLLSEIPGSQVVGVDISIESIEYAKKYYCKENISYQLANVEEFISTMPEYDYVVSRGVIEHIPNGLHIILAAKWRHRLLFDVPYDEPKGNPHHLLLGIREKDFSEFSEAELFYEDLEGVIYDAPNKPSKPNMIMCVCSRPSLTKLKDSQINFPIQAWPHGKGIQGGNNITWLEKKDLLSSAVEELEKVDIVLDIGCGIMPQRYVRPLVHICCEPFAQYGEHLKAKTNDELDRQYIIIKADWREAVEKIPHGSVDSIFLIDVVEHLEKEEGLRLLKLTEKIARRQIVLFTPLGFMPQEHPDGKDAWGMEGGEWQEHKSGWMPEDFDESWDIYACEDYHVTDNRGVPLEKPFGAFWAIKNIDSAEGNDIVARSQSIFDDVILILRSFGTETTREDLISGLLQKYSTLAQAYQPLQDEHQQLKNEHQQLQRSRAVIFAMELEKHPFLMKLASISFDLLAKVYNLLMKKR